MRSGQPECDHNMQNANSFPQENHSHPLTFVNDAFCMPRIVVAGSIYLIDNNEYGQNQLVG